MVYKKSMYKKCAPCQRRTNGVYVTPVLDNGYYVKLELGEKSPSLAAVYGISQTWRGIDDSCVGFERGTVFNELDKPFMGDKCKNGGYCK